MLLNGPERRSSTFHPKGCNNLLVLLAQYGQWSMSFCPSFSYIRTMLITFYPLLVHYVYRSYSFSYRLISYPFKHRVFTIFFKESISVDKNWALFLLLFRPQISAPFKAGVGKISTTIYRYSAKY